MMVLTPTYVKVKKKNKLIVFHAQLGFSVTRLFGKRKEKKKAIGYVKLKVNKY